MSQQELITPEYVRQLVAAETQREIEAKDKLVLEVLEHRAGRQNLLERLVENFTLGREACMIELCRGDDLSEKDITDRRAIVEAYLYGLLDANFVYSFHTDENDLLCLNIFVRNQ